MRDKILQRPESPLRGAATVAGCLALQPMRMPLPPMAMVIAQTCLYRNENNCDEQWRRVLHSGALPHDHELSFTVSVGPARSHGHCRNARPARATSIPSKLEQIICSIRARKRPKESTAMKLHYWPSRQRPARPPPRIEPEDVLPSLTPPTLHLVMSSTNKTRPTEP